MIKHRLNNIGLYGLVKLTLFSLCVMLIASCENEFSEFQAEEPDRLFVAGDREAAPDDEKTYTLSSGGTGTWSVDGPATITENNGTDVTLTFTGSGDVALTVEGGGMSGRADISVAGVSSDATVTYRFSGVVNDGGSELVFFTFAKPLAAVPTIRQNGKFTYPLVGGEVVQVDSSAFYTEDYLDGEETKTRKALPFVSGGTGELLGDLEVVTEGDMTKFQALYNAGTSPEEGTIEVLLEGVAISSAFGGASFDSLYLELHRIDVVSPITDVQATTGWVSMDDDGNMSALGVANDSTDIYFTVAFNEEMRTSTITDVKGGEKGTYYYALVDLDYTIAPAPTEGGVDVTDTLWATDDASVWVLHHITSGLGDGSLTATVDMDDFVDLGGNALSNYAGDFSDAITIDNTPDAAGGSASGAGSGVLNVNANSNEFWLVRSTDAADAPTLASQFIGVDQGDHSIVVAPGDYLVYFLHIDAAGNVSDISAGVPVTVL